MPILSQSLICQITDTQHIFINSQLSTSPTNLNTNCQILAFVDARNLPCPMPLLKTKLALRQLGTNTGAVYTVSTDPNSANDLTAFCQKNGLDIEHWQSDNDGGAVFHFLISKIQHLN